VTVPEDSWEEEDWRKHGTNLEESASAPHWGPGDRLGKGKRLLCALSERGET